MVLSYDSLLNNLDNLVEGANPNQVQAASIDVTLGDTFKVPVCSKPIIRLGVDKIDYNTYVSDVIIKPHSFILATTKEKIIVPNDMGAWIEGKSSIGRSGLFIQNAGWIAPGFSGEITLELYNANDYCLRVDEGLSIGQVIYTTLDKTTSRPYRGRYLNQVGATAPVPETNKTFDAIAKVKLLKVDSDKSDDAFLEFDLPILDIPYDEYSIHADKRITQALIGYNLLGDNYTDEDIRALNHNIIGDDKFKDQYYKAYVSISYDFCGTSFEYNLYPHIDSYEIVKAEYVKVLANATFGKPAGKRD